MLVRYFRRLSASSAAEIAIVAVVALLSTTPASRASAADAAPYFLVATSEIPDSMFAESVVLVLPTTDTPIVAGVIINKPTTVMVRDLFPNQPGIKSQTGVAYLGGPVDPDMPALIARAGTPPVNAAHILRDIYISTDRSSITALLSTARPADLRVIVGRAQWTREQLRAEISEGSWYVEPAASELIFSDPKKLWRLLVERGQLQEVESTRPYGQAGGELLRVGFFADPTTRRWPVARLDNSGARVVYN